jgi:hypothetical protein
VRDYSASKRLDVRCGDGSLRTALQLQAVQNRTYRFSEMGCIRLQGQSSDTKYWCCYCYICAWSTCTCLAFMEPWQLRNLRFWTETDKPNGLRLCDPGATPPSVSATLFHSLCLTRARSSSGRNESLWREKKKQRKKLNNESLSFGCVLDGGRRCFPPFNSFSGRCASTIDLDF